MKINPPEITAAVCAYRELSDDTDVEALTALGKRLLEACAAAKGICWVTVFEVLEYCESEIPQIDPETTQVACACLHTHILNEDPTLNNL